MFGYFSLLLYTTGEEITNKKVENNKDMSNNNNMNNKNNMNNNINNNDNKDLSPYHIDVIIGLLLSDATIAKRNKGSRANAYFSLTQTCNSDNIKVQAHIDLVNHVFDLFRHYSNFDEPHVNVIRSKNKEFKYLFFNTKTDPLFTSYYNIWYIDGVKTVPSNIAEP